MFKFFGESNNSKNYKQISKLGLFSDSMCIQYVKYEQYFREFQNSKLSFCEHIKILIKQHLTPLKIIKSILFVHAWLQSVTVLEDSQSLLDLMSHFLKTCSQLIASLKEKKISDMKISKSRSVVMNLDTKNSKQIAFNKQIFLLEDIIQPYILYIQKIITVFSFYSSIRKNMFRLININQVWIIMNLFKCANAVISKIPIICRFIRKSYKPIAQSLGQAFSLDFNFFYRKIYKFLYSQCNKIAHDFDILGQKIGEIQAYIQGVEGTESILNLVQEIQQLNLQIHALYGEPAFKGNRNIIHFDPIIDLNDEQIQFILYIQKMKNNAELYQKTPKFYRSYQSKMTVTNQKQQFDRIQLAVFRDISNENYENQEIFENKQRIVTFRKIEEDNDVQKRVANHLMIIKSKNGIKQGQ